MHVGEARHGGGVDAFDDGACDVCHRHRPRRAKSAARLRWRRLCEVAAKRIQYEVNIEGKGKEKEEERKDDTHLLNPPPQIRPLRLIADHKPNEHTRVEPAQRHLAHPFAMERSYGCKISESGVRSQAV
jgi:hypothetical protein